MDEIETGYRINSTMQLKKFSRIYSGKYLPQKKLIKAGPIKEKAYFSVRRAGLVFAAMCLVAVGGLGYLKFILRIKQKLKRQLNILKLLLPNYKC